MHQVGRRSAALGRHELEVVSRVPCVQMTNVHLLAASHVKHFDVNFERPRAGDTEGALQDVFELVTLSFVPWQNATTVAEHSSLGAWSQSSSFWEAMGQVDLSVLHDQNRGEHGSDVQTM